MADVTTLDPVVQPHPIQLAIRVDSEDHELRASEAAEVLSCLSDIAGLIAGSDYVELAEADPVDAEKWKSLSLVIREMTTPAPWNIVAVLPGCTPEQANAFAGALTSVCAAVSARKAETKREDEDVLVKEAAGLLVKQTADIPRTPPVEKVQDIVSRLSALSLTVAAVTVRQG